MSTQKIIAACLIALAVEVGILTVKFVKAIKDGVNIEIEVVEPCSFEEGTGYMDYMYKTK